MLLSYADPQASVKPPRSSFRKSIYNMPGHDITQYEHILMSYSNIFDMRCTHSYIVIRQITNCKANTGDVGKFRRKILVNALEASDG